MENHIITIKHKNQIKEDKLVVEEDVFNQFLKQNGIRSNVNRIEDFFAFFRFSKLEKKIDLLKLEKVIEISKQNTD